MNSDEIRDLAINALEDLKGLDITTIDVRPITVIADYMIICTGRSTRHIYSLAENVAHQAKEKKLSTVRVEGDKDSEWALVDLGDVIVHVMSASARTFYSLEDLWEPVKEMREQKNKS